MQGKQAKEEEEALMDTVLIGPSEVRVGLCVLPPRADTDGVLSATQMVNLICKAVELYRSVWSTRDESKNIAQAHDEDLAKDKIRPVVTCVAARARRAR